MSQYPGTQPPQPPQDPYYGQPPSGDPYGAAPQPPNDPYFGAPPQDPYAPPRDPYRAQPTPEAQAQAQQQAWYAQAQQQAWDAQAQQQAWDAQAQQQAQDAAGGRGGSGAAIFGLLLVLLGAWILFGDQLDIDLEWGEVWPIGAVVIGALMVVASVIPRRRREG